MNAQQINKPGVVLTLMGLAAILMLCCGCSDPANFMYRVHEDEASAQSDSANGDSWASPNNLGKSIENGLSADNPDEQGWSAQADGMNHLKQRMPRQYHIGRGDVLKITVNQLLELNRDAVLLTEVDAHGRVYLPVLEYVEAEGLTVSELRDVLADRLQREFMKDPQVHVSVHEYVSKKIMLLGNVASSGPMPIDADGIPLLDVICRSGGVRPGNAGTVEIIRNGFNLDRENLVADPRMYVGGQFPNEWNGQVVQLSRLFDGGKRQINPIIYAGDVVYVPPSRDGVIYVSGAVKNPGTMPFRRPLSLMQAVAAAGGFKWVAAEKKCQLIRNLEDGSEQVVEIDIHKVRRGEQENMLLARNDLIVVPVDPGKAFLDGLDSLFRRGVNTAVQVNYDMGADMGVPAGTE